MITYSNLKNLLYGNVWNNIRILLNYPKVIVERQQVATTGVSGGGSGNPFLNPSAGNNLVQTMQQSNTISYEFDCLYSSGRDYIVEQDRKLGLSPSLRVYIKVEDVKNSPLQEIRETDYIIFKNKRYAIKALSNLYDILYAIDLK